ncbi:MAG: hypothetical protein ACYCT7_01710 [bacterium]
MKTFKNKITIYINDKSKQIYDLQKNKSEFIDNLILEYSKKVKDDLIELKNLEKNIEFLISQNTEIKNKNIDIINLLNISQTNPDIINKFKNYIKKDINKED